MSTYNLDAEIAAMQFVISVLLSSHHDKKALLAAFDTDISMLQVAASAEGGLGMSSALRESLKKYRADIERAI